MFSRWGKAPVEQLDPREPCAGAAAPAEDDHRYYAGIALKTMIEKWTGDPEKGRFVIAHKAHLIADAMVNANREKKEVCSG